MSGVGGVQRTPQQTQQAQGPQKTAQAKSPQQAQQLDAKQFAQVKGQVKLPSTNVNALTQLPSKDQTQLMKLTQDNSLGRMVQNLTNARKQIQADVMPKSLLGAGQTTPPAAMRAMAAAAGKLFAGRDFEIEVGRETTQMSFKVAGKSFNVTLKSPMRKGAKHHSEEDEEDDIEESL